MLTHYLKIAFRNLWKAKTQNIISIIGLAIGFTCFAFSTLWIRHEMSYDSFHANADRIYRVNIQPHRWDPLETGATGLFQEGIAYQLVGWLKSNFPQIEDIGASALRSRTVGEEQFMVLFIDDGFSRVFDLPLSENFFTRGRTFHPIAITDNLNVDVESFKEAIAQEHNFDVEAIIPAWSAHTNIRFDMVAPLSAVAVWTEDFLSTSRMNMFFVYILMHRGIDIATLQEQLYKIETPLQEQPVSFTLTSITSLRYNDPTGQIQAEHMVQFGHIRIFAIAGLLVILCALFNHLTLYITRVRMRLRELALRKVHGASNWQVAKMLYIDFLLIIVLSLVAGFLLMTLLLPTFKEYASITSDTANIYAELALYAVLLVVCGFIVGGISVLYFRKQVLNEVIKSSGSPGSKNLFRKGSLLVQLIISLVMMFCTTVCIKQMHFLHQQPNLLISQPNIAFVRARCCPLYPHLHQFKQIPGIVDAIPIGGVWEFLNNIFGRYLGEGVDSAGNTVTFTIFVSMKDNRFFDFFGVEVVQGTLYPNERKDWEYLPFLLNETAMKEAGGILSNNPNFWGVVQDFYITPTTGTRPLKFFYLQRQMSWGFDAIAFRYEEGMRQQVHESVTQWFRSEFPEQGEFMIDFDYTEDLLREHLRSERALFILLSAMSLVAVLIAVFGVYSLTSLTCQQRRKEIAIRKVHGAEVVDITSIFFKEYFILFAIAAVVAFPAGYIVMRRWLENYVLQTPIEAWLFVAIFLLMFAVIVLSIISIVWRAANQNPADVVKSE